MRISWERYLDGQTGFRLGLQHCFQPDVSFVSRERMKLILPHGLDGMLHAAPDLAVEVLSPSDSITKTEKKMQLYLAHGARLGWMIDTKTRMSACIGRDMHLNSCAPRRPWLIPCCQVSEFRSRKFLKVFNQK